MQHIISSLKALCTPKRIIVHAPYERRLRDKLALRVCVQAYVREPENPGEEKNVTILICDHYFSGLTAPILFILVAIESLYSHYVIKMPLDFRLRL